MLANFAYQQPVTLLPNFRGLPGIIRRHRHRARVPQAPVAQLLLVFACVAKGRSSPNRLSMNASSAEKDLYRPDGVRITHDPFAPGMIEKYGRPGETDSEGFDPYADTVGPGIYGGIVKRDDSGRVVVGRQYQNHNPRPGPVYAGGGYTPTSIALRKGEAALASLLDKYPDLVNEVSTGGATPLHMCGMGRDSQAATAYVISRGGDIEAEDTYGYRPLHRMVSNNLAIGARALLEAGADPAARTAQGETPMSIALESRAHDVVALLREYTTGGKC